MRGLMMHRPLLVSSIIEHAADQFGHVDIVSRESHGPMFRYTYAECAARSRKLANALRGLGLERGAVIGTLAWNQHRHLEAYYGISGGGMVIHTCNPRLHPEQLIYIINHAEDRVLLFDPTFATLIQAIAPRCPRVKAWICLCDDTHLPALRDIPDLVSYEGFIDPYSERFAWPEIDEHTGAALCYTSGTTGNPKGVCFSHRAIVLNAITICIPNVLGLSPHETILPVVPLFHVNGWSIPYGALIAGARLVLPGPRLDGAGLYELFVGEGVTVSAGVPTVWLQLLQHLERDGLHLSTLKRIISGGAAIPTALVARLTAVGIEVRQGWGMTETVAVATMSVLEPAQRDLPPGARHTFIAKQGKSVFGVEIKVVGEDGKTLPRDGVSQGELLARGQWIASGYYKSDDSPLIDGWFPTGDIATIGADGMMQIRDRAKDLIKTGGEWISSLDLENAAAAHPAIAAVAVIGVAHPKWQERPLMFVVCKPGCQPERAEILAFVAERVASWWVPDDVVFLDALPVGGTGKVQKTLLRERYADVFSRAP